MELVMVFAIGVVIGCIFSSIIRRSKSVGALRIDSFDPDGPFMFLELSKGVDIVASKKYVVLKVNLKNFIPQK